MDISTAVQPYTGQEAFWQERQELLDKPLDPKLVKTRKGGSSALLKYIEGHTAIDQANRLFGYGNWSYRPLSVEQVVLLDPITGEAVGVEYKALVEVTVRGAIAPTVDIGSQPVAAWNVEDQCISRRASEAKYHKRAVDESDFSPLEKKNARAVITEAHEQAKKGAVTDALKRALRSFGNAFGNSLYGDGHIIPSEEHTVDAGNEASNHSHENGKRHSAPSQLQSEGATLAHLVLVAKNRAKRLGLATSPETWEALLQESTGEEGLRDEALTLALIARINGHLTGIERKRKEQAQSVGQ